MSWIKVTDCLPQENKKVLLFIDDEVVMGFLTRGHSKEKQLFWKVKNWLYNLNEVSHWMNVPDAPERKDD